MPLALRIHLLARLQLWLKISPQQLRQVYLGIYDAAQIADLNYWIEIVLSAGIAVFGLVLNSPAVIIGAMLISPLMGPIMATGLALAAGDLYLALKALAKLVISTSLAIGFSAIVVYLLPFRAITAEVLARTKPTLLDLGVALFSGLAGSVAVSRSRGGGAMSTLPGVAIAVALMPPLCTVGFGLGNGGNMAIVSGAGLLFLTNLVAIVASAFVIFLMVGMNSPLIQDEVVQSGKSRALAEKLFPPSLIRAMTRHGQLHWRALILVILLAIVALPLKRAFVQVADEAKARAAVQDAIRDLVPSGTLVSQQVDIGKQSIGVHLIVTHEIADLKLREAEATIQAQTHWRTQVAASTIASQEELAELMQKIPPPAPPAPPQPETLEAMQAALVQRLGPVLDRVWPAAAPLEEYSIAFGASGIVLNAVYASRRNLDPVALDLLQRDLREALDSQTLTVSARRVAPSRARQTAQK